MNRNSRNKQKERQETFRMLSMISQFGINMLVPIFLCFFAGMYIDKKLGTSYWMIILFFFGAIVGFRNVYVFAKRSMNSEASSRQKQLEAMYQTALADKDKASEKDSGVDK